MQITLIPVRMDTPLQLIRSGDVLSFNGVFIDLNDYNPDTAVCDWIAGQPERTAGVWQVEIILPHGSDAPEETRFPAPITLTRDGEVALPAFNAPPPAEVEIDLPIERENRDIEEPQP